MVLNFTGDVVLADIFEKYRTGIGSRLSRDEFDPFVFVNEYFAQGDLNVINLESVLASTTSQKNPWSGIMLGDPSFVGILKKNRIHVVNLANNHSLDHGIEAFLELTANLDAAGIAHFGGPRNTFQDSPTLIARSGQKVCFLGYYIEESLISAKRDSLLDKINANIKKHKHKDVLLVLSLHWGSEYSSIPFSWMINEGKKLIDSGVDILYGHHSHTYQGITSYRNGIFAPSLGNFIFEDRFIKHRVSAILQVEYTNAELKFKSVPFFINLKGVPVPSSKKKREIDSLNSQLDIIVNGKNEDCSDWDSAALKQVKWGHIKNRLKIRFIVITHPWRYLPFIFKRYGN